ncbi:MAG: PTS sugar transporter subunit IIB [Erysipelotrichaceae bacterium]|nr:PTS sugar transporter subunit IIB [Erysipelotrichaceae bacterium]
MKKIYLFCSAGMSTSMLASKMQAVAKENNFPVEVKAFSHSKIDQIVNDEKPDVILLGPQVKHLYAETEEKFGKDYPVAVIDADDYGLMRGDKVLRSALIMMKNRKK